MQITILKILRKNELINREKEKLLIDCINNFYSLERRPIH